MEENKKHGATEERNQRTRSHRRTEPQNTEPQNTEPQNGATKERSHRRMEPQENGATEERSLRKTKPQNYPQYNFVKELSNNNCSALWLMRTYPPLHRGALENTIEHWKQQLLYEKINYADAEPRHSAPHHGATPRHATARNHGAAPRSHATPRTEPRHGNMEAWSHAEERKVCRSWKEGERRTRVSEERVKG